MNKILESYTEFINDPQYVYTVAQKNWIVILQKTENTIHNEKRDDIMDEKHASYKGNYFNVKKIFNKITYETINEIDEITYYDKITYIIDKNVSTELPFIIKYYKVIQRAYYLHNIPSFTGTRKYWHNNGYFMAYVDFVNGVKNGVYIRWYINGNTYMKGTFLNNEKHGLWTSYHKNGKISSKGEFMNGVRNGEWYFYDKDGNEKQKSKLIENEMPNIDIIKQESEWDFL